MVEIISSVFVVFSLAEYMGLNPTFVPIGTWQVPYGCMRFEVRLNVEKIRKIRNRYSES